MNERLKFLEALSDVFEISSIPYSDRSYLFQEVNLLSDSEISSWIRVMDESSYGLADWIEALIYFQSWLQEQRQGKNFTHQIEYLSCCTEGNLNSGRLLTLKDLLKTYLDTFGIQQPR